MEIHSQVNYFARVVGDNAPGNWGRDVKKSFTIMGWGKGKGREGGDVV